MSSLVKKGGTLFTPKLKKVVRKKPVTAAKPPATPPATQVKEGDDDTSTVIFDTKNTSGVLAAGIETSTADVETSIATPASTQLPDSPKSKPAFRIGLTKTSSSDKSQKDNDIDPKDSSKQYANENENENENAIASSSEEDDDEDIFKPPVDPSKSRRQSITQRRLSNITASGLRSRSASISLHTADSNHVPAKIGIPVSKPTKRRRSLAQARSSKRVSTTQPAKPKAVVVPTVSTEPTSSSMDKSESSTREEKKPPKKSDIKGISDDFIVGIDPKTQKLTKFRRKGATKVKKESDSVKTENESVKPEGDEVKVEVLSDTDSIPEEPDNLITTVTHIHQIPKNINDEDADLSGEVDIDLEEVTMADLCKPTLRIGKVSTNFELVREAEQQLKQKKAQRRRDRELARLEGISLEDAIQKNEEQRRGNGDDVEKQDEEPKPDSLFDEEPQQAATSLQLTFTDGKIGFNEESAIVAKPRADITSRSVEKSNPFANPITSTTYSRRVFTDKWTSQELNQFYQALSMFGTDFSLISQLFPHRSRKQIKLKFNLEERRFPEVVELALRRKLPVDFEEYCANTKNDIKSLEYYNEELRKVRIEHEQSMNAIALEREKALKEDAEASRRREIEIRTGSKPMSRAEKLKELRKNETVVGSIDDVRKKRETNV